MSIQTGELRVIDVCVCGNTYVDASYNEKVNKYGKKSAKTSTAESATEASNTNIKQKLGAEVFPLIVDERGTFHKNTLEWMKNSKDAISKDTSSIFDL